MSLDRLLPALVKWYRDDPDKFLEVCPKLFSPAMVDLVKLEAAVGDDA